MIPRKNKRMPGPDQPSVFQIRIKGHLDPQWADWFDGMAMTPEEDGDTLLTGPVADQAALHGLIRKVRDLGIPLVSIQAVPPDLPSRRLTARTIDKMNEDIEKEKIMNTDFNQTRKEYNHDFKQKRRKTGRALIPRICHNMHLCRGCPLQSDCIWGMPQKQPIFLEIQCGCFVSVLSTIWSPPFCSSWRPGPSTSF